MASWILEGIIACIIFEARMKRNPNNIRHRYFQIYLFKYASDFIELNSFNYTTFAEETGRICSGKSNFVFYISG